MKRLVVAVVLAVMSCGVYAQKGAQSVGFNLGYGFDSENATIGLDYRYNLTNEIRLAPQLTHFVKNDGLSAWAIDMNVHYVVPLSDLFAFYPIGGIDLSFWKFSQNHFSDNRTRLGLNIGLGADLYASPEITVGVDVKYNIIKHYDQALASVRVAYNF